MKHKLGLMVVAVVAAVSVVGAASAQQGGDPPPNGSRRGAPVLRELVQIVADDLSIEPAALLEQLRDQTLADVIAANGGSVATISADVTAAVTERVNTALENGTITQERADTILAALPDRIASAINGEFRGLRPGLGGDRGQRGGMLRNALRMDARPLISAAVDATGLTAQEIAEQVRAGATLGEVVSANGSTPEAVIAAAVATLQTRLDEAVANGRLTQAQADAILGGAQAFYEAAISGSLRPEPPIAPDSTVSFTSDAAV